MMLLIIGTGHSLKKHVEKNQRRCEGIVIELDKKTNDEYDSNLDKISQNAIKLEEVITIIK